MNAPMGGSCPSCSISLCYKALYSVLIGACLCACSIGEKRKLKIPPHMGESRLSLFVSSTRGW